MEVEETTNLSGEEVSNPSQSEQELQTPEEIQNGADPAAGADDKKEPESQQVEENQDSAGDAPSGFSSIFAKARQAINLEKADDSTEAKSEDKTDATKEDNPNPDDKEPEKADEKSTEEEKEKDSEKGDDKSDDKAKETEEPKKPSRVEKYQTLVSENETLKTQVDSYKTRLETLETQFEQHGGVEVVENAMELFGLASDKSKATEFVEMINSLPHHATIQKQIFDSVIDLPANRVYGINRVLSEDFGLSQALPQPVLEKVFEFVAARANADIDDLQIFLDRELELFADGEKTEVEKLREEVERLKAPPKTDEKTNTPEETQENPADFATRLQRTYDTFEDKAFEEVSASVLKDYGFIPTKDDSPELVAAKNYLATALKFAVGVEMRTGKAHETLIDYWIENVPEDNKFFSQAAKAFKNSMRVKVQAGAKTLSHLLGAVKAEPAKEGKEAKDLNDPTAIARKAAQPGSQRSDLKPPAGKKPDKPQGFSSAFSNARKSVGK